MMNLSLEGEVTPEFVRLRTKTTEEDSTMPHRVDGVTPTGNISILNKQWVGGMAVTPVSCPVTD
jgi:hypothetical protein